MDTAIRYCLECNKKLVGRSDKKFCDEACRNAYHNRQKVFESKETKRVRLLLNKNRKILKGLLKEQGELDVKREKLVKMGFDFAYHTHYVTSKVRKYQYIFIFDYGYRDGYRPEEVKVVKAFSYRDE